MEDIYTLYPLQYNYFRLTHLKLKMESSCENSTRHISAIFAVALAWIFWPILSPTLIVLNTIAFLPFSILFTIISTVGEGILFVISIGSFGMFMKDTFENFHQVVLEKEVNNDEITKLNTAQIEGSVEETPMKVNDAQEDVVESKLRGYALCRIAK